MWICWWVIIGVFGLLFFFFFHMWVFFGSPTLLSILAATGFIIQMDFIPFQSLFVFYFCLLCLSVFFCFIFSYFSTCPWDLFFLMIYLYYCFRVIEGMWAQRASLVSPMFFYKDVCQIPCWLKIDQVILFADFRESLFPILVGFLVAPFLIRSRRESALLDEARKAWFERLFFLNYVIWHVFELVTFKDTLLVPGIPLTFYSNELVKRFAVTSAHASYAVFSPN